MKSLSPASLLATRSDGLPSTGEITPTNRRATLFADACAVAMRLVRHQPTVHGSIGPDLPVFIRKHSQNHRIDRYAKPSMPHGLRSSQAISLMQHGIEK